MAAPTMTVPERPAGLAERPRAAGPAPGDSVGRFVVEGEGPGGLLLANDPSVPRRVALRLLRPEIDDRERMLHDARALARIAHPNVVAIHDVGTLDDGQLYLALDLVEGKSLRAVMVEDRSMASILDLFVQAGRGLAAAHDAGVLHRDFKPDHVLVGSDGRARVTDFSLVRAVAAAPRGMTLAASSDGVGTPEYLAPEQHVGAPASPSTDQFAFAVSLYEALAGHRPFQGTFEELQLAKLGPGRLPWPAHKVIPPSLTHAIDRALRRDPNARHPSMKDFLFALESAAPPPELSNRPRNSGPPTAMSAPIQPGAYAQYPNTRPPPPIQMVAAPPKPDRTIFWILGGVGGLVLLAGLVVVGLVARARLSSAPSSKVPRIPPAGPMPAPPAFSPIVASPNPDSKYPCPPGSTFRRAGGVSVQLMCVSATNAEGRDGVFMEFDTDTRRLSRYEPRLRGKLEGYAWTFNKDGSPSAADEYHEGQHTAKYLFRNGKLHTREHYDGNVKDGLTEFWNPLTGEPGGAELYRKGVLVGRSF